MGPYSQHYLFVTFKLAQKLVFVLGRPFQSSQIFVLPYSGASERYSTRVGYSLTHKHAESKVYDYHRVEHLKKAWAPCNEMHGNANHRFMAIKGGVITLLFKKSQCLMDLNTLDIY